MEGVEAAEGDEPRATRIGAGGLTDRCVSVVLGGSTYGIPIRDVQEIIGARPLTRVFKAPPALAGVTSLRGDILTVIDLSLLLGIASYEQVGDRRSPSPPARATGARELRIVVVRECGGAQRRAGLRVDALGPVRELPRGLEGMDPAPATVAPGIRAFLRGVITDPPLCAVLDVSQIFDAPVLAALAGRRVEGA